MIIFWNIEINELNFSNQIFILLVINFDSEVKKMFLNFKYGIEVTLRLKLSKNIYCLLFQL